MKRDDAEIFSLRIYSDKNNRMYLLFAGVFWLNTKGRASILEGTSRLEILLLPIVREHSHSKGGLIAGRF
jgi:hypothetical protein